MNLSRRSLWVIGALLFFLGIPTWFILGAVLVLLVPDTEWPKDLALIAFAVPLSVVAWREHVRGRTRGVGHLAAGWLLAASVIGGGLWFVLTRIGPIFPRG